MSLPVAADWMGMSGWATAPATTYALGWRWQRAGTPEATPRHQPSLTWRTQPLSLSLSLQADACTADSPVGAANR